jgi:hypothetical protein
VVAAKDEEIFWVLNLICEKEADGLQRLLSSVDVITQEEVVCLWWEAAILEET